MRNSLIDKINIEMLFPFTVMANTTFVVMMIHRMIEVINGSKGEVRNG